MVLGIILGIVALFFASAGGVFICCYNEDSEVNDLYHGDNGELIMAILFTMIACLLLALGYCQFNDSVKEECIKAYLNGEYVVDTLNITQRGVITDIKITDYKVKSE